MVGMHRKVAVDVVGLCVQDAGQALARELVEGRGEVRESVRGEERSASLPGKRRADNGSGVCLGR